MIIPHSSTTEDWDYASAPESLKVSVAEVHKLFIGGKFVKAADGGSFPTVNPATEAPLASIANAGEKDVDRAVRAARKALRGWRRTKPLERGKLLYRIARRIQERSRELAVLETMDGGKPIRESRDVDLPLTAAHFFHHAGWADKLSYVARQSTAPDGIGVCAQVIPWNFPLMMAAWKIAPALACGNTVILKPAETTSLTALRLAEILQEVDCPPGVVNIITGAGDTGRLLVEHSDVDKVAFTGSTSVGKQIARSCAGSKKRLTLELGGKGPHIVFADAPIDQAIEGVVRGIWFNQGHVCCAGSRLLVEESIAQDFIRRIRDRMKMIRVGDPLDKNTDLGAINSLAQLNTIKGLVETGVREGADRFDVKCALPERGFWHLPTLFTRVQPSHSIAREEIFGPVLSVMTFRTPGEAIARANDTPYGLSAGVWTNKASKAYEMAQQLRAGVVWLNCFNEFDPASPFGGVRESGFGREGGMQGLAAYLREEIGGVR
ncbi:MAG: aldehyde dehydrogenase family protein [Planctomycetota bacterium]|nr:aldehyde dehydrogenase family protein [Planctomycetota bacterium]